MKRAIVISLLLVPLHCTKSEDKLAQSCDKGNAKDCFQFASWLDGPAKDKAGARARFKQACDLGHAWGCSVLADKLAAGLGGPADRTAAIEAKKKACKLGLKLSCDTLRSGWPPSQ